MRVDSPVEPQLYTGEFAALYLSYRTRLRRERQVLNATLVCASIVGVLLVAQAFGWLLGGVA
jgi:hypothetical protein